MKIILHKLEKFFDLRVSWFFVNGNKTAEWTQYLAKKYPTEKITQDEKRKTC